MKPLSFLFLVGFMVSTVSAQYCELVGYEIWAQDDPTKARGTFLGDISTSTTNQYSIMNKFGDFGSTYSAKSIWNEFSVFGDAYSNTSAYNKFATKPPAIWEYIEATGTYYLIGYLTTNTTLIPRYTFGNLITVLSYGNCAGCTPTVRVDTLTITKTIRDTIKVRDTVQVVKRDTVKIRDTLEVVRKDTLIKIDTLRITKTEILKDTVKIPVHDTIRWCPATIRRSSPGRTSNFLPAFTIHGRTNGACKD